MIDNDEETTRLVQNEINGVMEDLDFTACQKLRLEARLAKLQKALTCDHDWDLLADDDYRVYQCKKCGFARKG